MLEKFRPKKYYDSIQDVDFAVLKEIGIRGLLIDLDDTLLPRRSETLGPLLYNFVENLKEQGFKILLLSNNFSPARVKKIAKELNVPYIPLAYKPLSFGFRKAMRILDLDADELAIIGDQIFMDIWGGNRMGIYTILVKPLSAEKNWCRQLMRDAEQWVMTNLLNSL